MKKLRVLLLTLSLIATVGCSNNASTTNTTTTTESTNTQKGASNNKKQQPDDVSKYQATNLVLKSRDEVTNIVKDTFVSSYDEVDDSTMFFPASNDDGLKTCVMPLIGFSNNDGDSGGIMLQYIGQELTMFETIVIKTDNNRYEEYFGFDGVTRNVELGYVQEYASMEMDKKLYRIIEDMVNSSKTIVRFSGSSNEDYELSNQNKKDLKTFLDCYKFE